MTFAGIDTTDDIVIDDDDVLTTTTTNNTSVTNATTDSVEIDDDVDDDVDDDETIESKNYSAISSIPITGDGPNRSIHESNSNVDLYRFHVSHRKPSMSYFSSASKLLNSH